MPREFVHYRVPCFYYKNFFLSIVFILPVILSQEIDLKSVSTSENHTLRHWWLQVMLTGNHIYKQRGNYAFSAAAQRWRRSFSHCQERVVCVKGYTYLYIYIWPGQGSYNRKRSISYIVNPQRPNTAYIILEQNIYMEQYTARSVQQFEW